MSSSELRRRANAVAAAQGMTSMTTDSTIPPLDYDESNLSARALLSASPVHTSVVYKMNIPIIYSLLPYTVRWILHRCFPRSWSPRWKCRRLIALGSYIYKFDEFNDNDDSDGGKLPPKGLPIPVSTADVRIVSNRGSGDDDDDNAPESIGELLFSTLPEGCHAIFEVSSGGKTQYFAVKTLEEANTWVSTLRQMKQDTITRSMGHSTNVPYPVRWESFDTSAHRLIEKKSRIKSKMESLDRREQEMQTMGGAGVTSGITMGYYS